VRDGATRRARLAHLRDESIDRFVAGAAATKCLAQRLLPRRLPTELGQNRQLEEEHVPGVQQLVARDHRLQQCGAVRRTQGSDRLEPVRVTSCQRPRDRAAPVMPDDMRLARSGSVDQGNDVRGELTDPVVAAAARPCAGRIAALVGRQHPQTCIGEQRRDLLPRRATFRIAVQENDDITVARAAVVNVENIGAAGELLHAQTVEGLGLSGDSGHGRPGDL
jgi:hypothetical protein